MLRIGCFKGWTGFAPIDVLAGEWSVLPVELLAACLSARVRVLVDAAGTPRARCADTVARLGGRAAYVSDGPARARPLAEALARRVDVVVTGPVEEVAPVAAGVWSYGWRRTDLVELAGAAAAGLVLAESTHPRLVELYPDGHAVITRAPGAPGPVREASVREVLRGSYTTPEVEVDLDGLRVYQDGPDRVAIEPVAGRLPVRREERQNVIIDGISIEAAV
ncbi:acyclic terpene utilization AtuA family protein [Nonomuraea sp. NPDC050328]|uniref:acyclic terpene utilization AtuA family protein n=1 Tax=Nonomuraea sp. NPDC050328 TaxID=3364361 RepID=UPI00378F1F50